MRLIYYPAAPYSRRALVAAYEKGIPFEREVLQPLKPNAFSDMRKAHGQPLAQIPMLKLDDGSYLRESSLIVEYFDLLRPDDGPRLVPADPHVALRVRAIDKLADAMQTPSVHLSWSVRKPIEPHNVPRIEASRTTFWTLMDFAEPMLENKNFFVGDSFTMGDISMSAVVAEMAIFWATPKELDRYPNIKRWFAATQARPSWQRVHEDCVNHNDIGFNPG
jgi:glutathione S-transferase